MHISKTRWKQCPFFFSFPFFYFFPFFPRGFLCTLLSCRDSQDLGSFRLFLLKKSLMIEFTIPFMQYLQKIHSSMMGLWQNSFCFVRFGLVSGLLFFSNSFFPGSVCLKVRSFASFPSQVTLASVCLFPTALGGCSPAKQSQAFSFPLYPTVQLSICLCFRWPLHLL